jgi:hypothetical protein
MASVLNAACRTSYTVPRDSYISPQCNSGLVDCPKWFLNSVLASDAIYDQLGDDGVFQTRYPNCENDLSACPKPFKAPEATWTQVVAWANADNNCCAYDGPDGDPPQDNGSVADFAHFLFDTFLTVLALGCDIASEGACAPLDPEILGIADYVNDGVSVGWAIANSGPGQSGG